MVTHIEKQNEVAIEYFNNLLTEHGVDVKALGWGSGYSQYRRFKIFSEIGDLRNKSVLDIGCGFGDFYGFLKGYGFIFKKYVGLDINETMLKAAIEKYPDADLWNAHFEKRNILLDPMNKKFDYVFASGIFSLSSTGWTQFMRKMLIAMFDIAVKGVGVNFLSSYAPGERSSLSKYISPNRIIDFVTCQLSSNFVLRHDYLPNDFTVYAYKDQNFGEN